MEAQALLAGQARDLLELGQGLLSRALSAAAAYSRRASPSGRCCALPCTDKRMV